MINNLSFNLEKEIEEDVDCNSTTFMCIFFNFLIHHYYIKNRNTNKTNPKIKKDCFEKNNLIVFSSINLS